MNARKLIRLERIGAVARITFDQPDRGNVVDAAMATELLDAAATCDQDPSIRCVLLTGSGKLFCGGGDAGAFAAAGDDAPRIVSSLTGVFHAAISRLARMDKPLVTAVNGGAAGAGLGLAILGDIVLAGTRAHFSFGYTAIGFSPDGGTSWLLPRLIGLRRAQEMVLTNRRVGAEEAAADRSGDPRRRAGSPGRRGTGPRGEPRGGRDPGVRTDPLALAGQLRHEPRDAYGI